VLEEQLLDANRHNRRAFRSGVVELDEFLHSYATQQIKKGVTAVRVLVEASAPANILGYYSLSAAQIEVEALTESLRKKLPRYPLPCFRMGRLAVGTSMQGRGLGAILIGLAVSRCLEARQHVASFALLVDAKDERAKLFYEHHGFTACIGQPLSLFLALGDLGK